MIRIPLLKDNHNHLFTYSNLNRAVSIFHTDKKHQALKILGELNSQKINIATGWFDSYYKFTQNELNSLKPLIICNNSLHKYIFNKSAAEIISDDFNDWVENNSDQIWVEKNIMKILSYISGLFDFDESSLHCTIDKNLKAGACFAADMFVTSDIVFDFLLKSEFQDFTEIWTDPDLYSQMPLSHKNLCKGVKLFTDGALGASTAAIKNYKTKGNPILTYSDKELEDKLSQISELKTDVAIHCIGDIAIEQVINAVEKILKTGHSSSIRLEHAQFITKKQAKKAKDLGLILSMQPNFNMDSVLYADRLNNAYCVANNPFRMLIDDSGFIPGKDLIFGSDGMPTGIDGCLQESLFPPVPGQALTLEEFSAAYCCGNYDKGYINVHIDQLKKKVITEVVI